MTCSSCQRDDTLVWAHNGGFGTHQWEDEDESTCGCGPQAVCLHCDGPIVQSHGFVVLEAELFAPITDTLQ